MIHIKKKVQSLKEKRKRKRRQAMEGYDNRNVKTLVILLIIFFIIDIYKFSAYVSALNSKSDGRSVDYKCYKECTDDCFKKHNCGGPALLECFRVCQELCTDFKNLST